MSRRLLASLAVVAALTAACTGGGASEASGPDSRGDLTSGATHRGEPTVPEALAAAQLPECPSYDAPPVDGGLPDVALDCLGKGPPMRLAGVRGPAVVNLWASWCTTCAEEMPILEGVRQRAGDRVQFVGVDFQDERLPGLMAAEVFGLRFPSAQDPDADLRAALRVTGLPVTLFVREDGTVAGRKDGAIASERELVTLLDRHLGVRL